MFFYNQKFLDKFHSTLSKLFDFEKKIKLLSVDFQKPWWDIIWKQKWVFGLEIFSEVIQAIFAALTPLILGYAIQNLDVRVIIGFVLGYAVLETFNRYVLNKATIFYFQSSQSIKVSAYQHFLTVDPIFHSTKSSGQIINKIERGVGDLEEGLIQFIGGILPVVVGFATVVFTIGTFDPFLAVVGVLSFVIIIGFNYISVNVNLKSFYKYIIKDRDKASAVTTENLQQNALIRSAFATNEQSQKTTNYIFRHAVSKADFVQANGLGTGITRMLYICSVAILSLIIFRLISENQMDKIIGTALIITYINGSSQVLRLGQNIQKLSEKYASVNDLFEFVRNFGKQSFPVLEEEGKLKK